MENGRVPLCPITARSLADHWPITALERVEARAVARHLPCTLK